MTTHPQMSPSLLGTYGTVIARTPLQSILGLTSPLGTANVHLDKSSSRHICDFKMEVNGTRLLGTHRHACLILTSNGVAVATANHF